MPLPLQHSWDEEGFYYYLQLVLPVEFTIEVYVRKIGTLEWTDEWHCGEDEGDVLHSTLRVDFSQPGWEEECSRYSSNSVLNFSNFPHSVRDFYLTQETHSLAPWKIYKRGYPVSYSPYMTYISLSKDLWLQLQHGHWWHTSPDKNYSKGYK